MSNENGGGDPSSAESAVADAVNGGGTPPGDNGGNPAQRPENVPEKFWDSESGTVKHDDVLKSYGELESRFGSFTGSPDEYSFNMSEDMTAKIAEMGVEVSIEGDPLYEEALKMAQETGMNQEGFDRLANLYVMNQISSFEAEKQFREEQFQQLGERAESRVNNIDTWGQKNLSPELYGSMKDALTSASMVPVLEHLISSTRNAPVDTGGDPAPSINESEVRAMQFAKDDHGNRKINTDPAYRAEYQKKMAQLYGDAQNKIIVGN